MQWVLMLWSRGVGFVCAAVGFQRDALSAYAFPLFFWWLAWRPDCCASEAPPKSVALQGHATPVACQYVAQCCCAPHC